MTTRSMTPADAPVPTGAATSAGRATTLAAAAAGAIAGAAAIAVGEIIASLISGTPSLVLAIGDLIIDLQPPGAKQFMADTFGTNDKLALNLVIVGVAIAIAAGLGIASRRQWRTGVVGFGIAGAVAAFAGIREPLSSQVLAVLNAVIAVAVSLVVLRALLLATGPAWGPRPAAPPLTTTSPAARRRVVLAGSQAATEAPLLGWSRWDRRRFLILAGSTALGSLVLGVLGRYRLNNGGGVSPGAVAVVLPSAPPSAVAPSIVPADSFDLPGITPLIMPNDQFYRIDTSLLVPRVDETTWSMKVSGMVDTEVTLTYAQLQAMPIFEQYVTIACVSNQVGGDLVGNAKWTGVHLRDVLAMAGVQSGATQIVGHSVDDFTVGFPTAWAMDPTRDPMIALGMNGVPLPSEHGFPARLIIPGLYGYVSATKWLAEIELTTLEGFDAYWVQLGWAKEGPILTQSRIDVPSNGASVAAGTVPVAGVAWAPDRGISAVEISVDGGPWLPAELSSALNKATWVQWRVDWQATAGSHVVEVRATDGTGTVQTAETSDPPPDGARGHDKIQVQVS